MSKQKSNFLEVDSSILESSLLLNKDYPFGAQKFDTALGLNQKSSIDSNVPWRLATPLPGFVIKTWDSLGNKIFINLCKADEIPEPKDLSETELMSLWESNDRTDYKVPLSILDHPHIELDKSGKSVKVYDVAVNSNLLEKLKENNIYRTFVILVVQEGLENKFSIELKKEDFVLFKNRSHIGELKPHRIRCSSEPCQPAKNLIEEIHQSETKFTQNKSDNVKLLNNCECRLLYGSNILVGQFHLPKVGTGRDIKLDVGESRILLETNNLEYSADLFLPYKVNNSNTVAHFNQTKKMLTVLIPCITPA